jgi:hypothetical protein
VTPSLLLSDDLGVGQPGIRTQIGGGHGRLPDGQTLHVRPPVVITVRPRAPPIRRGVLISADSGPPVRAQDTGRVGHRPERDPEAKSERQQRTTSSTKRLSPGASVAM